MSASVRAADNLTLLVKGGKKIFYAGSVLAENLDHVLMGSLEGSASASLSTLRTALHEFQKYYERDRAAAWANDDWKNERLWIGLLLSEEELHQLLEENEEFPWDLPEVAPTSPSVFLDQDELRLRIEMRKEEKPDRVAASRLLKPFLSRHSASCEIFIEPVYDAEGKGFNLRIDFDRNHPRGATLGGLWKLGDEAQALLQAAEGDELPRSAALDLICAGRWDLFKGQSETEWLEAKGGPYDHLKEELGGNWRFELAKDVAAFANAPEGGVIVLGMVTKDRGDGDVIQGYKEFDLRRVRTSTYKSHVAQLVYPRVEGFEVKRIKGEGKGKGLAVLVVPPQAEASKPFLVQGTTSDKKVMGAHVLLPVRRGDDTALMDAGAVHTRIRLGEQVISGEQ